MHHFDIISTEKLREFWTNIYMYIMLKKKNLFQLGFKMKIAINIFIASGF